MAINTLVLAAGAISAAGLLALLGLGLIKPEWRVWPAPPSNSIESLIFWTLFRVLNVAAIVSCLVPVFHSAANGDISATQVAALVLAAALGVLYAASLWGLGHKATYCRTGGLETRGVYGLSRNPQYATAIAAYACLAVAGADAAAVALALLLISVYALMAFSEERWLETSYGASYVAYKQQVPRFFSVRRAAALVFQTVLEAGNAKFSEHDQPAMRDIIQPPRER